VSPPYPRCCWPSPLRAFGQPGSTHDRARHSGCGGRFRAAGHRRPARRHRTTAARRHVRHAAGAAFGRDSYIQHRRRGGAAGHRAHPGSIGSSGTGCNPLRGVHLDATGVTAQYANITLDDTNLDPAGPGVTDTTVTGGPATPAHCAFRPFPGS